MKKTIVLALGVILSQGVFAQTDPAITSWLINTTGITGRHYVSGNSTPVTDTASANVQLVQYSNDFSYINCSGIPAYIVGPYLDGNPALATNNAWLFKIPLNPSANTGTLTEPPLGCIGVFINGVPMYDYKDAASYSSSTQQDEMQGGDGVWNRNAILAENDGFDCAKGHPSPIFNGPPGPGSTLEGGSYHHHQNPTAYNLDIVEVSNVCDLYLADGLYTLDSTQHAPLIGFAFDGYPVYGGYGYSDPNDPQSPIKRIESSYQYRNITQRTHYADGTDVTDGPAVNSTYPIGWYREDYEFIQNSGDLDEHNGRLCKTPEYPNGTYAYFATVDANWNSAYPYLIGPTYYGIVEEDNFTSSPGSNDVVISEPVSTYTPTLSADENSIDDRNLNIFPNPASDLVAIQITGLLKSDLSIVLYDMQGKVVQETEIKQGSTIWYLDTRTVYDGQYIIRITDGNQVLTRKLVISR
ncbi:MAG: YHYH protein [Crocinitomicaceae bacterium]